MKRATALLLTLRLSILVALAASAALLVEYRNAGDPAFCGTGSGCFKVRISEWSHPGGVPMPVIGLAAFLGLFALAITARSRLQRRALAGVAGLGALAACALIAIQHFAVQAWCPWCLAVDGSAIVAAVAAVGLARVADDDAALRAPSFPWVGAAAASLLLPFLWGRFPMHPALAAELEALRTPAVDVVQFTDFECPFCRMLAPMIDELRAQHAGKIHYERRMAPLEQIHPGARVAALAYVCTPEPERDAVAAALYAMPPEELTREGIGRVANPAWKARFDACVDGGEGAAKVDAEKALFEKAQGRGLPYTLVERTVVMGADPERLAIAVETELEGGRPSLPVPLLFLVLGAIYAGTSAITLRGARRAG